MLRSPLVKLMSLGLAVTLALAISACGGDDDDASSDATGDTTSQTVGPTEPSSGSEYAAQAEARGEPEIEPVEAGSELKIIDDVVGTGKAVEARDTVTVQYSGASASNGVVFDSSWMREATPATFPLDAVIEGWATGLVGMKEGGRRTLVIPPDLAYGANPPAGASIEPNAALIFVVDLIKVG